jgi:hypothetical protein
MKHIISILFMVAIVATFSCTKQHEPDIVGKWETVMSIGFKWQCEFAPQDACRELPDVFPGTRFCYDYTVTSRLENKIEFTVKTQYEEKWVWSFVDDCSDIADVTVTSTADSSVQRFILKRIE